MSTSFGHTEASQPQDYPQGTPAFFFPQRRSAARMTLSQKVTLTLLAIAAILSLIFAFVFPYVSSGPYDRTVSYVSDFSAGYVFLFLAHMFVLLILPLLCFTQRSAEEYRYAYVSIFSFLSAFALQAFIQLWGLVHSILSYGLDGFYFMEGFYFHIISCVLTVLIIIVGLMFVFGKKEEGDSTLTSEQQHIVESIHELLFQLGQPAPSTQTNVSPAASAPAFPRDNASAQPVHSPDQTNNIQTDKPLTDTSLQQQSSQSPDDTLPQSEETSSTDNER